MAMMISLPDAAAYNVLNKVKAVAANAEKATGQGKAGSIDEVVNDGAHDARLTALFGPKYIVSKPYNPDAAAYVTEIRTVSPYAGFYERSDLVNFILRTDMQPVPFGETGFYGVTSNMAFPQRNSNTTRGDMTQVLLTDSHEWVLHVVLKLSDNDPMGFYHTRRLQAAMFPRKSELPPDRYAREAVYRN
ncbi:hypothetical protein HYU15_02300 [Candidatus Woesearchaeota archaeon]|nr:hypothetical protein [Candidatus Woesearchaeota archaeon]